MEIAKIYVSESCAQVISKKPIPAGLVGGYIDVVYAEDLWADLSKTVVFRSNITRDVVTDGRRVPVPADVLAAGVRLWVGFFGVAGDKALPTFWASLGTVGETADPSGDESTDPALPVWAQILDKTAELEKKVDRDYQPKGDYLEASQLQPAIDTALAQAKESGAFDGPPGKDGADGQPGKDGKDGADGSPGKDGIDGQNGTPGKDGIDGQDGAPGKSAYEYAKDGGYTGTEEEFAAKLAAENPGGADWNAAEGEPGHVLNRTHYASQEIVDLIPEATYPVTDCYTDDFAVEIIPGKTYIFTWNGVDYERVAYIDPDNQIVIGSYEGWGYGFDGDEYDKENQDPFGAVCWSGVTNIGIDDASATSAVLSLKEKIETIEKLPMKFLPDGYPYTEKVFSNPVFDGNVEGREYIPMSDEGSLGVVKASPQYVSVDELAGATMTVVMGGEESSVPLTAETAVDATLVFGVPGSVALMEGELAVFSVPEDITLEGIVFTAGTWFFYAADMFYVKSISCLVGGETEIVHTIDPKYLPSGSGGNGGEFIVNLTKVDNSYSVDKTLTEIDTAYKSGKTLVCNYDGTRLYNNVAVPGSAYGFAGDKGGNIITLVSAVITNDGVVAFEKEALTQEEIPAELPNPKHVRFYGALFSNNSRPADTSAANYTVGNVSYDGSAYIHIKGLQNPYALTVNGTSYDGSSAVDLTDVINAMIDAKLNG